MNTLQTFSFESTPIRVYGTPDEPLFIATDICTALGLENARKAVGRLEADEYNTVTISDGNPGNPEVNAVNEAGLYRLVLESRKPEAKAFKRWLLHEVLPSIRKHGSYSADPAMRLLHEALLEKKSLIASREQLASDIRECDARIRELQTAITNVAPTRPLLADKPYRDQLVSREQVANAFTAGAVKELFAGSRNWKSVKRWWKTLEEGGAL